MRRILADYTTDDEKFHLGIPHATYYEPSGKVNPKEATLDMPLPTLRGAHMIHVGVARQVPNEETSPARARPGSKPSPVKDRPDSRDGRSITPKAARETLIPGDRPGRFGIGSQEHHADA